MKTFLHVGCGYSRKQDTTLTLAGPDWREVRLDINPDVKPDVMGMSTDMNNIPNGSMDAVFSAHNIEHVYAHEVPVVLMEFYRVLNADGFAVITCPDLKSLARVIADDMLNDPLYESSAGPITAHDILYGHGRQIAEGNIFMAHKSGFTEKTLGDYLKKAGFKSIASFSRGAPKFDIWVVANKNAASSEDMTALAQQHFPN